MTTARQKLADELDLALFRVIGRAQEMYDSGIKAEKVAIGLMLTHLRQARTMTRGLMSEADRANKGA